MKTPYAKIEDGTVVAVWKFAPGRAPEGLVETDGTVGVGFSWDGETFTAPTPDVAAPTGDDVNAERERRLSAGASFTVTGVSDPVPVTGRPFDQTVILGLSQRAQMIIAQGGSDTLTYRDGANHTHEFTPAQFLELATAAMQWVEDVMVASWTIKDDNDGIDPNFATSDLWP